jgi:thioredoxin 1
MIVGQATKKPTMMGFCAVAGRGGPLTIGRTVANVHAVNDLNFDTEVLQADAPVLVDFSAVWCGPCKQIAPLIDQLADEYVGKVKVTHLDIDESPGTASKYGIRGVPTLMVFKGGELVAQHIGAAPKTTIAQLMDRAL